MIISLTTVIATIFLDLVMHGKINDLGVRLVLGLSVSIFVAVYIYWRIFVARMAAYL